MRFSYPDKKREKEMRKRALKTPLEVCEHCGKKDEVEPCLLFMATSVGMFCRRCQVWWTVQTKSEKKRMRQLHNRIARDHKSWKDTSPWRRFVLAMMWLLEEMRLARTKPNNDGLI